MKVAVYAICKNEEKNVKSWYNSSKEADFHFILDTGSTDKTIENIKKFNISFSQKKILPFRFDIAKNTAIKQIPENIDFCISLDMDEVLCDGWKDHLYESFKKGITRPIYKYVWMHENGNEKIVLPGSSIHPRNGYFWKYPVHELLWTSGKEVQGICNLKIIHNMNMETDRSQYLDLLNLSLKENPNDARSLFFLARQYFFYNRIKESVYYFKKFLNVSQNALFPEKSSAYRYLYFLDTENTDYWMSRALSEFPDRREIVLDNAIRKFLNCDWKECLSLYNLSFTSRNNHVYPEISINTEDIYKNMKIICLKNIGLSVDKHEYKEAVVKVYDQIGLYQKSLIFD